jgi:exodeoxyribonuclease VII small subunit
MNRKVNFEEGMARLEGIVKSLEEGALPLDECFKTYEQGIQLSKALEALLMEGRGANPRDERAAWRRLGRRSVIDAGDTLERDRGAWARAGGDALVGGRARGAAFLRQSMRYCALAGRKAASPGSCWRP